MSDVLRPCQGVKITFFWHAQLTIEMCSTKNCATDDMGDSNFRDLRKKKRI